MQLAKTQFAEKGKKWKHIANLVKGRRVDGVLDWLRWRNLVCNLDIALFCSQFIYGTMIIKIQIYIPINQVDSSK